MAKRQVAEARQGADVLEVPVPQVLSDDLRQLCGEVSAGYVDFGCGRGGSMHFAETLMGRPGVGIERVEEKVEQARRAGCRVLQGDVLDVAVRGIAPASISVDLVPELRNFREFEALVTNMIRCARDFALIQHLSFDNTETLFARGLTSAEHGDKSIRFRPRIGDYLLVVERLASKLDISGMGIYGIGAPKTVPSDLASLSGALLTEVEAMPLYRSIRVVIARKSPQRLEEALRRAASGDLLVRWSRGVTE